MIIPRQEAYLLFVKRNGCDSAIETALIKAGIITLGIVAEAKINPTVASIIDEHMAMVARNFMADNTVPEAVYDALLFDYSRGEQGDDFAHLMVTSLIDIELRRISNYSVPNIKALATPRHHKGLALESYLIKEGLIESPPTIQSVPVTDFEIANFNDSDADDSDEADNDGTLNKKSKKTQTLAGASEEFKAEDDGKESILSVANYSQETKLSDFFNPFYNSNHLIINRSHMVNNFDFTLTPYDISKEAQEHFAINQQGQLMIQAISTCTSYMEAPQAPLAKVEEEHMTPLYCPTKEFI